MKEISDWFAEICLKFAQQENANPRCRESDWYVFCDAYEILFGSIHIELHQWLSRLTERRPNFQA